MYELADKTDPGNYYNMGPLLNLYVKTNNPKAKDYLESFYKLAPDKPSIYNNLEDIYSGNKKEDVLIDYYKEQLKKYKKDNKVEGTLYFYLGKMYVTKDKIQAKSYLEQSKDLLSKVYPENNPVFKAIDDGLKHCGA